MKQQPSLFTAAQIVLHKNMIKTPNGNYILARPLSLLTLGLVKRLKLAYRVFIGKYDALDWEE